MHGDWWLTSPIIMFVNKAKTYWIMQRIIRNDWILSKAYKCVHFWLTKSCLNHAYQCLVPVKWCNICLQRHWTNYADGLGRFQSNLLMYRFFLSSSTSPHRFGVLSWRFFIIITYTKYDMNDTKAIPSLCILSVIVRFNEFRSFYAPDEIIATSS